MLKNHDIILDRAADPFFTRLNGQYVYVKSSPGDRNLQLGTAASLDKRDLSSMRMHTIFDGANERQKHLWAPELHRIMGELVVYYAADYGHNIDHRMHALVARDPHDPTSRFDYAGQVRTPNNQWAIDMTHLSMGADNEDYAIWSGIPNLRTMQQNLYAAKFKPGDPLTLEGEEVMISAPTLPWERNHRNVHEGPTVLQHVGNTNILYAANCSWTPYYSIGALKLVGNNPLDQAAWHKQPRPLMQSFGDIHGPGHPTVTQDEYDNPLMAYHSTRTLFGGWDRVGRITELRFDNAGNPYVPDYEPTHEQRMPSRLRWTLGHFAIAANTVAAMLAPSL